MVSFILEFLLLLLSIDQNKSFTDPYMMGKIACANVLSDLYAMGVMDCDNMLMLLAVSTKMTEKERDVVIPLIMRGFKVRTIFPLILFVLRCIHCYEL